MDSNYKFLQAKIKQLETQGVKSRVKLSETIEVITQTKTKIEEVSNEVGVAINKKLRYVLEKDCGFETNEDFYDTDGRQQINRWTSGRVNRQ